MCLISIHCCELFDHILMPQWFGFASVKATDLVEVKGTLLSAEYDLIKAKPATVMVI